MSTEKNLPSKNEIKAVYESYNAYLTEILSNITNVLAVALKLSSRPTFKKRVKSFKSYYKKVLRLKPGEAAVSKELVPLTDMMGIRVICAFLEDINLAIEQIGTLFHVVEVEHKGGQKFSEFGYESVHVLVQIPEECTPPLTDIYKDLKPLPKEAVCEIQIRTILQDAWAEVEHELIYKTEFTPLDIPLRRKLASLNASLSLADITFQEIRDYQNKLQREISERRNSFYAIADNLTSDGEEKKKSEDISRVTPFVQGTIDEMILNAIHAHNAGNLDEAVNIYSRIIEANPVPPEPVLAVIHKHRGMAYFALNKYEEAISDFDRSISYDPKAFRTYYYKGIVYSIVKKYEEAIDCFTESLKLNEFQAHTHYRRALSYFELGEFEKSMGDVNDALSLGIEEEEVQGLREKLVKKFGMGM
ncbi:MAG: tetratricopeptide repeat protein [Treponema sp.]|nr:tetratricopeptide repeat protein [Treponema sp.]